MDYSDNQGMRTVGVTAEANSPRVEVAVVDMSASYRRAVLCALPRAVSVVDRFHVRRTPDRAWAGRGGDSAAG
jgi:transposase